MSGDALTLRGQIAAAEAERDAMRLESAGGDTERNRKTLEIFEMKERLHALEQVPPAAPPTLDAILSEHQRDAQIEGARKSIEAELAATQQYSPRWHVLMERLTNLSLATAPAPVEYERDGYRWEDVNLLTENIGDAVRDELRTIFKSVGFLPGEVIRAIGAYASEAPTRESVDYKARWGEDFPAMDAAFSRFADRLPKALYDKLGFRHRPAMVEEIIRVMRERERSR